MGHTLGTGNENVSVLMKDRQLKFRGHDIEEVLLKRESES